MSVLHQSRHSWCALVVTFAFYRELAQLATVYADSIAMDHRRKKRFATFLRFLTFFLFCSRFLCF